MSDGYDYPDADTIPPVKPQSKPHALSREQVEVRLRNLDEAEALVLLAHDADQRQALAQQAQEVERLRGALSGCVASLSVYVNGGNPASPYKNGANPCYVLGSREALDQAQRALKGAHD